MKKRRYRVLPLLITALFSFSINRGAALIGILDTLDIKIVYAVSEAITTSQTWYAPDGIYSVNAECWGGGGAGGGFTTNRAVVRGGGGAGGQYVIRSGISVTPGTGYPVVVGSGGTGTTGNGGAGGDSTFNTSTLVAKGGAGGQSYENGYQAGQGSTTGGSGDTIYRGGNGSNGGTGTTGGAGGGGAGSGGNGGDASGNTAGAGTASGGGNGGAGRTSSGNGNPGITYGGAGGAAASTVTNRTTNYSGGNGAAGRCVITYYDTWAPSINQATYTPTWTFSSNPSNDSAVQISMTATAGYDYTTPIEYYFTSNNSTCPTNHEGTGGSDSSWQTNTSYSDSGLDPNKCYGYTVQARDSSATPNTGPASSISYTYTSANTPGAPTLSNPTKSTLSLVNNANNNPVLNPTTLFAAQVTYSNPSDSEWDNKWIDADGYPSDTEVWLSDSDLDHMIIQGLLEETEYGVSVKAKNEDGEETSLGSEGTGTTLSSYISYEETFTTSGTWYAPNNVYSADVECWGGGGGGGGSAIKASNGGGGGGGGAYAKTLGIGVTPGVGYTVTIGSGGSGGNQVNGSPGGDSSFNTNSVIAVGGGGGGVGTSSAGSQGTGGQAGSSTGDTVFSGGDGALGSNPVGGGGGEGSGSTSDGGDASGQTGGTGTDGGDGGDGGNSQTDGNTGSPPGSGGGGAGDGRPNTGYTGGDGTSGQCTIYYRARLTGTLSCNIVTSCPYGTVIYKMSDLSNAHAELPNQSSFSQLVCCSGVIGLSNSCTDNYETILKLSDITNAHVEQADQGNYSESVCIKVPTNGILTVGYQEGSCDGYDAILGSISEVTNAHVGDADAYTKKICATALATETLTFTISNNYVGFGTLDVLGSRYATGDTFGSSVETVAHTLSASTNNPAGYSIYVQGSTLQSVEDTEITIESLGDPGAEPQAGTEQFGIRATDSGGNGEVAAPYNSATYYAFGADENTSDIIATDQDGDDVLTNYSLRYIANIYNWTEYGTYSTSLTYIITSNF